MPLTVLQTPTFERLFKKLKSNQQADAEDVICTLLSDPTIGESKKGDLQGVRVHKFRMAGQLALLAYLHDKTTLTLLAIGTHENFYRNLKRQ